MGEVKVRQTIARLPATWVFETRQDAGRELAAELVRQYMDVEATVLAIPRGGVPVGQPIALELDAPLDVIIPRKIPIPWDPEAGFGAVTADGTIVLNEEIVPFLSMTNEEIRQEAEVVRREIERRTRAYRGDRPPPRVEGRLVVLTDDGLATGLTMVAAIRSLRPRRPARVLVAVPAAPRSSLRRVGEEADEVLCLIEQIGTPFAVASYYRHFRDLSDAEVMRLLAQVTEGG